MEPPRKPDQIAVIKLDEWEAIVQGNIDKILEGVESGDRKPLDHMALPFNIYLNLATWMTAIENYIIASEQYFKDVEEEYKKIMEPEQ